MAFQKEKSKLTTSLLQYKHTGKGDLARREP